MPRTNIPAVAWPGGDSDVGTLITPVAADVVNLNETVLVEGLRLLAYNPTGGALTVTITSTADSRGRTNDISAFSLAAGKAALFGPFSRNGWTSTGGKLFYQGSAAGIVFIPILPD